MKYLGEHSLGSLLKGTFAIYAGNFGRIVLAYFLPVFPIMVLQAIALTADESGFMFALFAFLGLVASLFATGALTLLISNACLGNQLSVRRAYKSIFSRLAGKLLWTNILQTLAIMVGLVLLIIPGLVLAIFFMLSSSVVVLERISGPAALKRSKQLGDGHHLRNAAALLLMMICGGLIGGVLGAILGALSFGVDGEAGFLLNQIGSSLIQVLAAPLGLIVTVLLYYDLRVRKEGYDPEALSEDIQF